MELQQAIATCASVHKAAVGNGSQWETQSRAATVHEQAVMKDMLPPRFCGCCASEHPEREGAPKSTCKCRIRWPTVSSSQALSMHHIIQVSARIPRLQL